ncbi:uncharacterized protein [Diadema antillarum]|uniref:uncharacterized protein isoform X4 n=1 Tax=Diadema antillarum TaxID=105358 RepID=UPI003A86A202
MAAYKEKTSDLGIASMHAEETGSPVPSLARFCAIVTALVLATAPAICALSQVRAQNYLIQGLYSDISALHARMQRLEDKCALTSSVQIPVQSPAIPEGPIEAGASNALTAEDEEDESKSSISSDTFDLLDKSRGESGSLSALDEDGDTPYYHDNGGDGGDTLLEYFGGKLSTNERQYQLDVSGTETTDRPIGARDKRQTENRESQNRNRHRESGRESTGQRGRESRRDSGHGDRRRECLPEPAFAHFQGDVDSARRVHPERFDPYAWTMFNVPGSWVEYWQFDNLIPFRQRRQFTLQNGNVTVHTGGFYYVYSQIQYYDEGRYTGHEIVVNGVSLFKCAESPASEERRINTCYIGGVVYLHPNSTVSIRMAFPNRTVNLHYNNSYFGLFKIA